MLLPAVDDVAPSVSYYWRWSDGSEARHRTFAQARFDVAARLPDLIVTAEPPTARRVVVLQYRDSAGWHTEDVARTDASGRARVEVNPYGADGDWAQASLDYRLTVDGRQAHIVVRFVRAPTTP